MGSIPLPGTRMVDLQSMLRNKNLTYIGHARRYREARMEWHKLHDNWLQINLVNSEYRVPSTHEACAQYLNYLVANQEYKYSTYWSEGYGRGSKIELDKEFDLIHHYRNAHDNHWYFLYEGQDTVFTVELQGKTSEGQKVVVHLVAKTEAARDKVLARIQRDIKKPEIVVDDSKINVGFWRYSSMHGADRFTREIDYRPWNEIYENYPDYSQGVLGDLTRITPETVDGKIALLYGPAGTGKTTFLRSLAHAWRKWADMEYVIDPEVFLNDAGYITEIMLGKNYDNARYRLVVLEDSGELIRDNSKHSTGQALSRLLNISDGILGAGRKIIIAITTNEKITDLHPAVTRPGRCMVKAEIGALSVAESQKWIGSEHVIVEPMTIAELYHLKTKKVKDPMTSKTPSPAVGAYL